MSFFIHTQCVAQEGIELWLQHGSCGRYTPRTLYTYEFCVKKFLEFLGGNVELSTIKVNDFIKYHKWLREDGYSEASVYLFITPLRELWKFLFISGAVTINWQMIPTMKKPSPNSHDVATEDDFWAMFNKIKNPNQFLYHRDRLLLSLLFNTGCRVSELVDLTLNQLNMEEKCAIIISKKNQVKRRLFWTDHCHSLLLNYLPYRALIARSDHLIISQQTGDRLHQRNVQRKIRGLREKAGIKRKIVPHSFRHGLGTRCVENRLHPRMIMEILGHKKITSSQIYMQVANPDIRLEYDKMFRQSKNATPEWHKDLQYAQRGRDWRKDYDDFDEYWQWKMQKNMKY